MIRHNLRAPNGRFVPRPLKPNNFLSQVAKAQTMEEELQFALYAGMKLPTINVVHNRLYGYKGIVVRAKGSSYMSRGELHQAISVHNTLNGFVKASELYTISKENVKEYLSHS